jgi:TrmH family RNA methyltransferase
MMHTAPKSLIQDVASLKQKKFREETGRILVEARHPIEEALAAGLTMQSLFFLEAAPADSLPKGQMPVEAIEVDEATMARMASTNSPPPCLAVFERPLSAKEVQGNLVLVLDSLQDPGNLGTLVRSAVAFGFETVILVGQSVEAYNPKVIRSSAGLIFAMAVIETQTDALLQHLPAPNWTILTTSGQSNAQSYKNVDYSGPCALVLGNEGQGVSSTIASLPSARAITIPMTSRVESLNVAVSGSVIMAEAAAFRRN